MYGWLELDKAGDTRAFAQAQCALCAHYGRAFRTRTRLLAATDPSLLLLLVDGLSPAPAVRTRVRCPLTFKLTHRRALAPDSDPVAAVAELQLVLAGEKLFDDRVDREGLVTRVASSLLEKDVASAGERLVARGFPLAELRASLRRQSVLEADAAADLDELSGPTAEGLSLIAGWLAMRIGLSDTYVAAAHRFGSTLGRLLYLVDALHDLPSDRARRRFNPLDAALGPLTPRRQAWLRAHFDGLVRAHENAFAALPLQRYAELLRASLVTRLAEKGALALVTGAPPPALSEAT